MVMSVVKTASTDILKVLYYTHLKFLMFISDSSEAA